MKRFLTIVSGLSILIFCSSIFAADLKVGIIDVQKILTTAPQVVAMRAKLKDQFTPRQKKINAAKKDLQVNIDKYNKNSSVMGDKQKKDLQTTIIAQQKKLRDMEVSFQKDLVTAQNQAMQTISKQIQGIVDNIAKQQKLDLVLIKGAIAYSNPDFDITDKVVAVLKKS